MERRRRRRHQSRRDESLGVDELVRASPPSLLLDRRLRYNYRPLFRANFIWPPPVGPRRLQVVWERRLKRLITIYISFLFALPRGSEWHIPNRLRLTKLLEFLSPKSERRHQFIRGGGGSFSAPPAITSVWDKCLVNHQSSEERVRLVCGFFVKHAMLLKVSAQGTHSKKCFCFSYFTGSGCESFHEGAAGIWTSWCVGKQESVWAGMWHTSEVVASKKIAKR